LGTENGLNVNRIIIKKQKPNGKNVPISKVILKNCM